VLGGSTTSKGTGSDDGWLVRIDAAGEKLWDKTFGSTLVDVVRAVFPHGTGDATVGYSQGGPTQTMDGWVALTDANGTAQWSKHFGGTGNQRLYGGCAAGENVVAVGYADAPGGSNAWLVKVDKGGTDYVSEVYGGGNSALFAVACLADDKAVAAGYSFKAGSQDGTVLKLKAGGTIEWQQVYGDGASQNLTAMAALADGGIAAAGVSNSLGDTSKYRPWVVRADASGNLLWQKFVDVAVVPEVAGLVSVGAGGFGLAGRIQPQGQTHADCWLARLDSTGALVWQQQLGGAQNDMFFALPRRATSW
jgi:hypothetical protein